MLEQENELSELLNCQNCSCTFDEPKILPCGKIVCTDCISIILHRINKTQKDFKCLLCLNYHELPKGNIFPTCEPLVNLCKKRSSRMQTNRCELTEILKNNLKNMKSKMNQLKKEICNGNENIKKHCSFLRQEILSQRDFIMNETTLQSVDLITQVNDYEKECIQDFEKEVEFKRSLNKDINEANKLHTEFTEYLHSGSRIKEKMLENANNLAETTKTKLEFKSKQLTLNLFNDRLMIFDNQVDNYKEMISNLLGKLIIEQRNDKLKSMKLSDFKYSNLRKIIEPAIGKSVEIKFVEFIDAKSLLIIFQDTENTLSYIILDILINRIKYTYNELSSNFDISNLFISKKKNVEIIVNIKDRKEHINYLQIFDHKLDLKNQVKIFENTLIGIDFNEINKQINIYCISNQNASSQIRIYNSKLEYMNSIGQFSDNTMKYYFSPKIKQLLQHNKRYYWLDNNTFNIVDEQSGNTIKKIELQAVNFILDIFNENLIFLDIEKNNLKKFDLDGNKLNQIELSSQIKKMFIIWNNIKFDSKAENSISLLDSGSLHFYQSV